MTSAGVEIYGVSFDDAKSHQDFIADNKLPFALVVDDGTLADAFGVPHFAGFAKRQSVLIGADGRVKEIWRDVSPETHAAEVLKAAGGS